MPSLSRLSSSSYSLSTLGLTRATLVIFDPPAKRSLANKPGPMISRIPLQFNPESISLSTSANWNFEPSKQSGYAPPEFNGTDLRSVSVEVFLDSTYSLVNTIEQQVEELFDCCRPAISSFAVGSTLSPPWVRLEWGRARTVSFYAYLSTVDVEYTLFNVDGRPSRATCRLSLHEIPRTVPKQNPTSGSKNALAVHQTQAGDSLASLAWRYYGDAAQWRQIAAANGIVDPERLAVGTTLLIPAVDEVAAGGTGAWLPSAESGS
uniref:CIS tube protein n=1 Tax=Kitasatospora sp. NBC_01519 TaxID=2903576 RepID=UPI002F913EEE